MMARRLSALAVVLAAACVVLAACSFGRTPPVSYFRLVEPPCRSAARAYPYTVAMIPLRATSVYQQTAVLYGPSPYELDHYSSSRWEATPAEMVTDQLQGYLQRCGLFATVTRQGLATHPDLVLQGRVTRFEEDDTEGGPLAVLHVDLQLSCLLTPRVVWQGRVEASAPMQGHSPQEVARAMSVALDSALKDVVARLVPALDQLQASGGCGRP